jgi:hypothetical protein
MMMIGRKEVYKHTVLPIIAESCATEVDVAKSI